MMIPIQITFGASGIKNPADGTDNPIVNGIATPQNYGWKLPTTRPLWIVGFDLQASTAMSLLEFGSYNDGGAAWLQTSHVVSLGVTPFRLAYRFIQGGPRIDLTTGRSFRLRATVAASSVLTGCIEIAEEPTP